MLDAVFYWLVVCVPVALGVIVIRVPSERENPEANRRWRIGLFGCLIVYSVVVSWQQFREKRAAQAERDKAVQDTSVAVTAALTPEIAEQKAEISRLQDQLGGQGAQLLGLTANARQNTSTLNGLNSQAAIERSMVLRRSLLDVAPHLIDQMQKVSDAWQAGDAASRRQYHYGKHDPQYFEDPKSGITFACPKASPFLCPKSHPRVSRIFRMTPA